MFFLIFYYYCFYVVGIFFVIQEIRKVKNANSFFDDFGDVFSDEDEIEDDYSKNNHEKKPIQKYEDKYKINKELMDDELSQEKLEGLCNCFILENTPNGNALILYNYKTSSFIYYSDNSIPYKYLNTLARKYVNTYRCTQLYVNSEDELEKGQKDLEKKGTEEKKEQDMEKKEQDLEKKEQDLEKKGTEEKKQIFVKFKNYNKNTTNKAQSQQQQPQKQQQSQEVIANRYTHQGKIANFNFLKKPDKKLINKKLSLSFSDYKKLNISI